jgi:hypothetical protein
MAGDSTSCGVERAVQPLAFSDGQHANRRPAAEPEPSTVWMVGGGLPLLAGRARYRRATRETGTG